LLDKHNVIKEDTNKIISINVGNVNKEDTNNVSSNNKDCVNIEDKVVKEYNIVIQEPTTKLKSIAAEIQEQQEPCSIAGLEHIALQTETKQQQQDVIDDIHNIVYALLHKFKQLEEEYKIF